MLKILVFLYLFKIILMVFLHQFQKVRYYVATLTFTRGKVGRRDIP
jgi:hypothetical protein